MRPIAKDLKDLLKSKSRVPRLAAHFIFPAGHTEYLSDTPFPVPTLPDTLYKPLVENWGVLENNAELRAAVRGGALEARQMTLSLINMGDSHFSRMFREYGLENIEVELYLYMGKEIAGKIDFPVQTRLHIDTFICHPPIDVREASGTINVDLVSPIMMHNPFVMGPRTDKQLEYPLAVGQPKGLPLIDLQTARWTKTAETLDTAAFTSPIKVENAVGFPSPPLKILIDNEIMEVTSPIGVDNIRINRRGIDGTTIRPHRVGAPISIVGEYYDYAVCTGPVETLWNLRVGTSKTGAQAHYQNTVIFMPGNDPAMIRFRDRPPWASVKGTSGGTITPPEEQTIARPDRVGSSQTGPYSHGTKIVSKESILTTVGQCRMELLSILDGGPKEKLNEVTAPKHTQHADVTKVQYGSLSASVPVNDPRMDTSWAHCGCSPGFSGQGTLTGATVKIHIEDAIVNNCTSLQCRVGIHHPDGSTSIIQTWNEVERDGKNKGCAWSGYSRVIDAYSFAKTWSTLNTVQVFVEIKYGGWAVNWKSSSHRTRVKFYWSYYWKEAPSSLPEPSQDLFTIDTNPLDYGNTHDSILTNAILKSVRVEISLATSISNAEVQITAAVGKNNNYSTVSVDNFSSSKPRLMMNFLVPTSAGISTWADVRKMCVKLSQKIVGPKDAAARRESITVVDFVRFIVSFQRAAETIPDEEIVTLVKDLIVDVRAHIPDQAIWGKTTPPELISWLLRTHGFSEYVGNFKPAIDFYRKENFFLNGVIDVGTRLHDALKDILRQSLSRFNYSAGKMFVLPYSIQTAGMMEFDSDTIQLRSFYKDKGNTDLVVNNVEIAYAPDYFKGGTSEKVFSSNVDSIARYQNKEFKGNFFLINDEPTAQKVANWMIERYAKPINLLSFSSYLEAVPIEKDDTILFSTNFEDFIRGSGTALSTKWSFGQGKNKKINTIEIVVVGARSFFKQNFWFEHIKLTDKLIFSTGAKINMKEEITLSDAAVSFVPEEGYGTNGYGNENLYGD